MKNIKKILLSIIVAFVAIWGSFYTENLTERQKREEMSKYNPEQLVKAIMKDSIGTLQEEALSIKELAEGIASGHEAFATKHGRTLGIGSPIFYVVKGECENVRLVNDEEIQGVTESITFTIPLKYIFGNTARDASGWFNIDNFQITLTSLAECLTPIKTLSKHSESEKVEDYRKRLSIKSHSAEQLAGQLSGGNQQKIVLAKWLLTHPKVLFLDEPTRGIDINAKNEIYRLIDQLASEGMAIIVVSSELPEIMAISDRIITLKQGRIGQTFLRSEFTEESILKASLPA